MKISTKLQPALKVYFLSLFKNMTKHNKQSFTMLLVAILLCLQLSPPNFTVSAIETAAANPRQRFNRNPGCDENQQNQMQEEYQKCSTEFTNRHHTNIGSAVTAEEHQKYTCKLLEDTVKCDELLSRCHSAEEVKRMKDAHIAARINQYDDNKDGINIRECRLAKDYIESGVGDEVDSTTAGGCTHMQANKAQTEFQECSHQLTQKVWDELQVIEDKKVEEKGIQERETNDVLEEEAKQDEITLEPSETKPVLCKALREIGDKCTDVISRCFSTDDVQQMRYNHVQQMSKYYASIYTNVDLSSCPALRDFVVLDPCENPDQADEYGNYPDCEDDIYPSPDDSNYGDNDNDKVDTQVSTSNNNAEYTTVPPTTELSSANNVVQDPTTSTTSESQDSNDDGNSGANAEANTQGNGNCNQGQFVLLLLTSIVLKFLLN